MATLQFFSVCCNHHNIQVLHLSATFKWYFLILKDIVRSVVFGHTKGLLTVPIAFIDHFDLVDLCLPMSSHVQTRAE